MVALWDARAGVAVRLMPLGAGPSGTVVLYGRELATPRSQVTSRPLGQTSLSCNLPPRLCAWSAFPATRATPSPPCAVPRLTPYAATSDSPQGRTSAFVPLCHLTYKRRAT